MGSKGQFAQFESNYTSTPHSARSPPSDQQFGETRAWIMLYLMKRGAVLESCAHLDSGPINSDTSMVPD